eukprot:3493367-Pyramimonas_sp.AAC.1
MYSRNLFTSTVEHGLWSGAGAFDWCKVIGDFKDRPWYTSTRLYRYERPEIMINTLKWVHRFVVRI